MLLHFHTTLAALEEKYGTGTEHAEEPTEGAAPQVAAN